MTVFPENPSQVLLAGDWHGNETWAKGVIAHAGQRGIPVIVHLGDFGFWVPGESTEAYLSDVEDACARNGVILLWVDGNHECFPSLYDLPVDPSTGVRKISDHVFHLPRGFRWTWFGKTWMALGGAHSVDRLDRIPGRSWWPEEHLTDDEAAKAIGGGLVDVIVAHDAPDRVAIPGLRPGSFPASEVDAGDEHREKVGKVVDATRPSVLFHGHYHVRYEARRSLPGHASTAVIGLADDGSSRVLSDNAVVLSLDPALIRSA